MLKKFAPRYFGFETCFTVNGWRLSAFCGKFSPPSAAAVKMGNP
jgi:hypothetical protein